MKTKTKLIASIMSICLVCAVFAIGVFALKTANLKIGGDVSFSATGVEADIKNVTLTGATNNDQVLATGKINTSMTQAEIDTTFQNWQKLELYFDANATDIELKFDIANTSTNANNYIEIDYSYTFSNTNPNVDVFPGDENDQKVWENNNYILAPKGATPAAGDYETFTLKFKVLDKELNVPQGTKISIIIELKHVTPKSAAADANNVVTIDNVKYTLNPSAKTASVTGHTLTEEGSSVVVYPVVMSDAESAVPCVVTGVGGFGECYELTSATLPNSVTSINETAFASTGLGEISIPKSVTTIGNEAFASCENLTKVTIPNSVTVIGDSAFYSGYFEEITIPSSVITIGSSAFTGCSVRKLTIPNSVTSMGGDGVEGVFAWCQNLVEVTISGSVNEIEAGAFECCENLEKVTIKNGVTAIWDIAFASCAIREITIPSSVTALGGGAFALCPLESITVEKGNSVYYSKNNCVIEIATNKLVGGCNNSIIPSGVTSIGYSAFEGFSIDKITIPSSVTVIEIFAFNCQLMSARFENPNSWFVADSADATEGTPVTVTSEFTKDNARVLVGDESAFYLIRKTA